MKYLPIPLILLMWGCSTPEAVIQRTIDNVIRYDTVRVTLPQETLFDTVYINQGQGESIKYIVKIDTLWKKVLVKGKADTIYVPIVDTITVTKTEVRGNQSDDLSFKQILYIIFGIAVLGFLGQVFRR